jgi:hypothetical protein
MHHCCIRNATEAAMHTTPLPHRVALRDLVTGKQAYCCVVNATDLADAARRARARAALAGVKHVAELDVIVEPAAHVPGLATHEVVGLLARQLDTFPLIQGVRA